MEYQNENFGGEYDFRSRRHEGWQISSHLHEYSELLYCKQGEGYATVNGRRMLLTAGQLVFIPPNYVHQYDFEAAHLVCAVFSNDYIPLFFKTVGRRHFLVSAVEAAEVAPLLDALPEIKKEDALLVEGYLNLICHKVLAHSAFDGERQTDGILYQKVISYLSNHYTEDITLSALAKQFGYNEKYLSHALHSLTGVHFKRLLSFYRVRHAQRLLESHEGISVAAVATESGFDAINTFGRAFKEQVGVTPSAYKRQFRK